jgi:hypothetical protein
MGYRFVAHEYKICFLPCRGYPIGDNLKCTLTNTYCIDRTHFYYFCASIHTHVPDKL